MDSRFQLADVVSDGDMDAAPIVLPTVPAPPRRPPVPFMAALVPVAAGVVLWLVTGSLYALCFAALGPLMIGASLVDGARSRRRERRRAMAEDEAAWAQAEAELRQRHDDEREWRRLRSPDAASGLVHPPLRGPQGIDTDTDVVVGSGAVPSGTRTIGGDGERARAFQERCGTLPSGPVTVPLGAGVCLRGAQPLIAAAARALAVQLILRFGPSQFALVGDRLEELGLADLPHARASRRGAFKVAVAGEQDIRIAADAVIWLAPLGADVPEGITTVIDVVEPRQSTLRTPLGLAEIEVECLSEAQASTIARHSVKREGDLTELPAIVSLNELTQSPNGVGLPAAIGRGEHEDIVVDIVEDGPHAIVTGTTGTGKSELLVTWVTAIASAHGPERVTFVLADFKGGTAFEPLRELPQVAAVITDLDEAGARRGVTSLTAELRRREAVLAAAGARDIRDVDMPRLIIVVDEFAALLQEHGDLGAVFTDLAARGRALGMHLILGTQRAAGVIRDALAANCPLRVSLRVGDAADSRLVIGTDGAAELPGGVVGRGLAMVRRPQDAAPLALRVALTGAADLRSAGLQWAQAQRPHSPWLPALPEMLPLGDVLAGASAGVVVLGRADDPARQDQPLEVLRIGAERGLAVLGAPGSGRSSLVRLLHAQRPDAVVIPRHPERAWDAVAELAERGTHSDLVLCDDVDVLLAGLPVEHAQLLAQRWEQILRGAAGRTIVLTAARASGPVSRMLDALPLRALLRMPSRVEHMAAGGEGNGFDRERPPGRARIGEREVQFAWVDDSVEGDVVHKLPGPWEPGSALTGLVSPAAHGVAALLAVAYPQCEVIVVGAEPTQATKPVIVVGEADAWQRSWPLWQRIRAEGEVMVRAENQAELRQLTGLRELPPYAQPHEGRAWSLRGAERIRRVVLPALAEG